MKQLNDDSISQFIIEDDDGTTIEFTNKQFRAGFFFSNKDDSDSGFYYVSRHESNDSPIHDVTWKAGSKAFDPKVIDKFREVLKVEFRNETDDHKACLLRSKNNQMFDVPASEDVLLSNQGYVCRVCKMNSVPRGGMSCLEIINGVKTINIQTKQGQRIK